MSDAYGFGAGYEPMERPAPKLVPEGNYMVTLGMPQDKVLGGYDVRVFPIKIDGFPDYKPDEWVIFAAPRDDLEKLAKWNQSRTSDFDAFKVPRGDFRPQSWVGKRGMLHFGKDKGGYMKALWSVTEDSQSRDNGNAGSAPQGAVRGEQPPFRDDVIPF